MPAEDSQAAAKAKAFFDKASKLAETKNFDYAIDMYLQGLRYAPDALIEGHLPLAELALHRQGPDNKKPSMMERVKRMRGKTPLEQMLNAEFLFAKDPDHLPYAEAMLKSAPAGGYDKTAGWIANLIFQTINATSNPSAQTYLLLKDAYSSLGQFDKAIAAIQRAVRLRPDDGALADEFKNLSAELTMARGKYNTDGDFRESIKEELSQLVQLPPRLHVRVTSNEIKEMKSTEMLARLKLTIREEACEWAISQEEGKTKEQLILE